MMSLYINDGRETFEEYQKRQDRHNSIYADLRATETYGNGKRQLKVTADAYCFATTTAKKISIPVNEATYNALSQTPSQTIGQEEGETAENNIRQIAKEIAQQVSDFWADQAHALERHTAILRSTPEVDVDASQPKTIHQVAPKLINMVRGELMNFGFKPVADLKLSMLDKAETYGTIARGIFKQLSDEIKNAVIPDFNDLELKL